MVELHLSPRRLVGVVLDGLEDALLRNHRTSGHRRVRETLGTGDHIRRHIKVVSGEGTAHTAETSDDLVKDEQNVVLGANLADALQVTHRWGKHASTASHRLDDLKSNICCQKISHYANPQVSEQRVDLPQRRCWKHRAGPQLSPGPLPGGHPRWAGLWRRRRP